MLNCIWKGTWSNLMANYYKNCSIITITCCFRRSQYQSWVENLERGKNRSKARRDWHRNKSYKSRQLHVEIMNSNNVEKIEIIFPSIHLQKQFHIMIPNITYNPDRKRFHVKPTSSSHFMAAFKEYIACTVFGISCAGVQIRSATLRPEHVVKTSSRLTSCPATKANK